MAGHDPAQIPRQDMPKRDMSVAHFKNKGTAWWKREDGTPHDPFILANLGERRGGRVLEVGSGRGAVTFKVRDAGWNVAAIDVNREFIIHCRKKRDCAGIEFVQEGAETLPFKDGVFDAVVSIEVLMHLPDPPKVFREMARVVRPGGRVIVSFLRKFTYDHLKKSVSAATGIYERKHGKGAFDYRYDTVKDLERYIRGTGLRIVAISDRESPNPCVMLRKGK